MREFINSFLIYNDFISKSEEEQFMSEVEPHLKRHIYEKDHWDDVSLLFIFTSSKNPTLNLQAIQGFRETERKHFNKANTEIVNRIKDTSFDKEGSRMVNMNTISHFL